MAAGRFVLPPYFPARDRDDHLVPGALLYVYENGTTTKVTVYAEEGLSTPLPNPVEANASGQFPSIWADAGTEADPVLYRLAITAADGKTIGNTSVFDNYRPSVDFETAAVALAESAAQQAVEAKDDSEVAAAASIAALAEILDIAANAPDAPSVVNKLDRDGDNAASDFLENVLYTPQGTGSVPRSQKSKNDDVLNAADFLPADESANADAAMTAFIGSAIQTGRKAIMPARPIVMTTSLTAIVNSFVGAFGATLDLEGAGIGKTIIDWRGSGPFLEISSSTPFKFALGGMIGDFSIKTNSPAPSSDGIVLRSSYNFLLYNIEVSGLNGDGFDNQCLQGDSDGNVLIQYDNIRISDCKGWGWKAAAATNHNENSGISTSRVFVQNCGTNENTAITGITQANPAVVTSAGHGRQNGDIVYIGGVQGMSQVNTGNSEKAYVVAGATTDTFQLTGVNSTGFGAFSTRTATVTGITNAEPAVVTANAHGFSTNEVVVFSGVGGMTPPPPNEPAINGTKYLVGAVTTNTFELRLVNGDPFDTTAYPAYTSGGTVAPPLGHVISARPKSGGVMVKGQICKHDRLFATVNKNVSLYIEPGPATAQGFDGSGVVIENPQYVGAIVGGIDVMRSSMGQSYANAAQAGAPCYFGYMFDGTTDSIQAVDIDKHTVRITADNPDYVQWAQCGTNVVNQTIRINNTRWKDIGYSRQKRFTPSFQFDSVQDDTELVVINSGSAVIRPKADCSGNKIPVRLRYAPGGNVANGEWAARTVTSIAVAPVGGAAATYYVYTYDDSNAVVAELSTTGYVTDAHGYRVKSDDPTRLFKGRVRTNGSGGFETTNLGWLNPLLIPGPQTGVPAWMWFSTADRTLRIKNSVNMPSQVDDSTYVYYSDNEIFTSSNVVVTVPAGPGGVFTTTITGTSLAVGDYIFDVQTPVGLGNFAARGTVNTAGTIQIIFWDPSNTGGSLNGGTAVRIQVTARRR